MGQEVQSFNEKKNHLDKETRTIISQTRCLEGDKEGTKRTQGRRGNREGIRRRGNIRTASA